MTKRYSSKKAWMYAFLFMLFGAVLMVVLVISFNKNVTKKEAVVKKQIRQIHTAKTIKKVAKPKPKPKPKPKKAQPKAPVPNMNSLLGGVAMDIPEFADENIIGDASELLKEIAEDVIMNENSVDIKPKVSARPPLQYPQKALEEGIKGYVVINILIDKEGYVEVAKVSDAQPQGVFETTALDAVYQWKFSPAFYKGKPVKIWVKQKISFK